MEAHYPKKTPETETHHQQDAELLQRSLEEALENSPENRAALSSTPEERETVYNDELGWPTKVVVRATDEAPPWQTYYLKNDAHDPPDKFVHMPDISLQPCIDYKVYAIENTQRGLCIHIGYQGRGYNFFYANRLEGLEFGVVNKTEAEQTSEQLRGSSLELLRQYEANQHARRRASLDIAAAEALIEHLPDFSPESPYRYKVDLFYGGRLYAVDGDLLTPIKEFGLEYGQAEMEPIHGNFLGNRLAIVEETLVLIDDENRIALGGRMQEATGEARGFRLDNEVVDLTEANVHLQRLQNDYLRSLTYNQQ